MLPYVLTGVATLAGLIVHAVQFIARRVRRPASTRIRLVPTRSGWTELSPVMALPVVRPRPVSHALAAGGRHRRPAGVR